MKQVLLSFLLLLIIQENCYSQCAGVISLQHQWDISFPYPKESNQAPGMAIVDISNPAGPILKDVWQYPTPKYGAGIVKVEGNYAYLGAMRNGLVVLDISDKSNITYVSELKPHINYPNPISPDSAKYNARGMAVRNSIVYLCYDAGGLRIIDAANKTSLSEIGHYSNPLLLNRPRAYNNLVLHDSLVYVAVDYCGMEVLNINYPSNITQVSWWDPWLCESPSNTWFNSGGHTNEIKYDSACKMVFMSSGRSQVSALSVANPALPDSCTAYGTIADSAGTWGIGIYKDTIYAAYIFVPLGIPFYSGWGGIKAISWNRNCSNPTEVKKNLSSKGLNIYPNPSDGKINIMLPRNTGTFIKINVYDIIGKKQIEQKCRPQDDLIQLSLKELRNGSYILQVQQDDGVSYEKIVILNSQ